MIEKGTKVAVYTRVSTDSDEQLNSLQNQQHYYKDFCQQHGLELDINKHMYADEGLTGTNIKRDAFQNMLYDAGLDKVIDEISIRYVLSDRKPQFKYIITKDVSRFSRNTDVISVVRLLRKKNVYIYFQNVNIDTQDPNYEFLLNMFLNFAQQESIDRSQKVIFGLKQRAIEGKFHFGSERLFGYGYDKNEKEIFVIEHEAKIIKKIFDLYVNRNFGSRKIANFLNEKGYKTQNDKIWTATGIVKLLKNEKYTGNVNLLKYSYGDVTDENRRKIVKDKSEWVHKENLIPQIIDQETFNKAQEILNKRKFGGKGKNTPKNKFSKKIKCARCGKNYIRSSQKQGDKIYYFYACSTRRRTGMCDNHSITLIRLENELQPYCDGKLAKILEQRKKTLYKSINIGRMSLQAYKKIANTKIESIKTQIKQKKDENNKLIDSFLKLDDTSELVVKAINQKIEMVQTEIEQLESELITYENPTLFDRKIQQLNELEENIRKMTNKKIFTLDEVLDFIQEIIIDGEDIEIIWTIDKLIPNTKTTIDLFKDNLDDAQIFLKEFIKTLNDR